VALFASFYRGLFVLDELLTGQCKPFIEVVGLATDDPSQSFVSPAKRVWSHPHSRYEETMVADLAQAHGIAVFTGRVKSDDFYQLIEQHWRPDICIMGTFGQKIDPRLYNYPRLGFFNLHPCAAHEWPTRYPGANPYGEMIQAGIPRLQIALHRVGDDFDCGELVGLSETVPIPAQTTVVDMHKLSAAAAAQVVSRELMQMIRTLA
jgi:methionyl-tRNA formyltransferase